jgi:hypothetical protein
VGTQERVVVMVVAKGVVEDVAGVEVVVVAAAEVEAVEAAVVMVVVTVVVVMMVEVRSRKVEAGVGNRAASKRVIHRGLDEEDGVGQVLLHKIC